MDQFTITEDFPTNEAAFDARFNTEQGITIVMVTHEAEMAAFAREMVHFLDGRVDGGAAA